MQRIGVFVCHCGSNIAATVDVKKVVEMAKLEPGVVHAEDYQYTLAVGKRTDMVNLLKAFTEIAGRRETDPVGNFRNVQLRIVPQHDGSFLETDT